MPFAFLRRLLVLAIMPLLLAACGADHIYDADESVSRARYISGEPPSITLFTVIRKSTGEGAHAGLMIDGSERILFDPAGTWHHPTVPERNDVHFGITPRMRLFYIDYHARETYDVIEQKVYVSPEAAAIATQRAEDNGSVNKAFCGNAVSSVLRGVPGFETIPQTFFPGVIRRAFGKLPGAVETVHKDGDPNDNSGVLMIEKSQL